MFLKIKTIKYYKLEILLKIFKFKYKYNKQTKLFKIYYKKLDEIYIKHILLFFFVYLQSAYFSFKLKISKTKNKYILYISNKIKFLY